MDFNEPTVENSSHFFRDFILEFRNAVFSHV
jgi:hypothetical protein